MGIPGLVTGKQQMSIHDVIYMYVLLSPHTRTPPRTTLSVQTRTVQNSTKCANTLTHTEEYSVWKHAHTP